jgi:hypothetical protein
MADRIFVRGITQEIDYTANERPVRIQYKCLFPIYLFPEMKLLFSKQNYNVLSSSSYAHISVTDLYISAAGKYVDRSWEYINRSQDTDT